MVWMMCGVCLSRFITSPPEKIAALLLPSPLYTRTHRERLFRINICRTGRFMSGRGGGRSAILEDEAQSASEVRGGTKP